MKKEEDVFDQESLHEESIKEESHHRSIKISARKSSYSSYKTKEDAKNTVTSLQVDELQEASVQSKVKSLKATSRS